MTIADIQTEARELVGADSNSYANALLLIRVNNAYEDIVAKILGCDGKWQFDDTNYTSFPIGITTLVANQQDYTFDITHLEIERVEVLDSSGIWHQLKPIDSSEIRGAISEYQNASSLPLEYDKQGRSLILYPAPSATEVTLTSGLKVYFKRTADLFTSAQVTTGTKVPGFASPFHILLSYKAALPFAVHNVPQRVPALMAEIARLEKELIKHYSQRELDRRKGFSMRRINSR